MPIESGSHIQDLLAKAICWDRQYPGGILVSTLPPLAPRSDDSNIFAEGENFSGIYGEGGALGCITPVVSPHVEPVIPKTSFMEAAREIFGQEAKLSPEMTDVNLLSPQVVVWWSNSEMGKVDLVDIGLMPVDKRASFLNVIARNTYKGVEFVQLIAHHPTIWGSYGFTPPEERAVLGLGRGGPTNILGHHHITYFNEAQETVTPDKDASPQEKLNFFAPWCFLFNDKFGPSVTEIIERMGNQFLGDSQVRVELASESGQQDSYQITFCQDTDMASAFGLLAEIAGKFEMLYTGVERRYEDYFKNLASPSQTLILQDALKLLVEFGFDRVSALGLINFVLRIKPTFGQLLKWCDDLKQNYSETENPEIRLNLTALEEKKHKYQGALERLDRIAVSKPLMAALIRDTYRSPDQYSTIQNTWSLHFSAHFVIDDYEVSDNSLRVHKINLLPVIGSTETGASYKLGALSRRK